jgi:serine/threonine protein kinase
MGVEDYHVVELVGEGSFGKVYKERRKYTRQVLEPNPYSSLLVSGGTLERATDFARVFFSM